MKVAIAFTERSHVLDLALISNVSEPPSMALTLAGHCRNCKSAVLSLQLGELK
jgi:hypothetical protein